MPTTILMPALSPTMEEGKLAKWHVKEGDAVKAGDILAEIETDKATMEFEAADEGRIARLLVPEGAEGIKVNQPIAELLAEGEEAGERPAPASAAKPAPSAKAPAQPAPARPEPAPEKAAGNGAASPARRPPAPAARLFASPLARRMAEGLGIDLASLKGSGPRGRIVKSDVEAKAERPRKPEPAARAAPPAPAAAPAPTPAAPAPFAPLPDARLFYKEGEYEAVPNDSMRKTIARRLASAKALVPHYYLTIDCDIGRLMEVRARLNERAPKGEGAYRLSLNDFVIKAAAAALMKHPDVNASWTDGAILRHRHADIGIAVDLNPGLITPILFEAETKGLIAIANEARALAERAKDRKLKPQEFEGGTFSISNLGMFGVKEFTAVINPPQSAILAVGAGEERAVVRDGKLSLATMMTLTLSCDHRVIDGAAGARFLNTLKTFLEEPASMLL